MPEIAHEILPSYYIRLNANNMAQLDVSEFQDNYLITRIIVPPGHRKKGYGNALMHNICTIADKNHRTLYIQPLTYNEASYPQRSLEEWYKKWGFKWFTSDRSIMRRMPKNGLAPEINKKRGMGWLE